ncbi:MAG: protein kinase [Acidobacteriota bacterium]|nr:protein kinase [Acidobacteriota bacterium]
MKQEERWDKIEKIFNQVISAPVEERISLIEQACGDDVELREEIVSLLAADDQSDKILEQPVFPLVAQLLDEDVNQLLEKSDFASYRSIKILGRGGVGVVFLAEDTRLERLVAVKILHPSITNNSENLLRFQQEARAASAISHQNVAHIYEFGICEGMYFLAMEYIPGKMLRELLKAKQIDLRSAVEIAIQIADALCTAHEKQITHRDIKPENIMLTDRRQVKVLDFGLAKLGEERTAKGPTSLETLPGMIMGTTSYMSPEQIRGAKIDGRTDLWSLGVVLYEMLTGERPFAGATPSDVQAAILLQETPVLPLANELPELNRIIQKALSKDVAARYQSAAEIIEDLRFLHRQVYDYHNSSGEQNTFEADKSNTGVLSNSVKPGEHKDFAKIYGSAENTTEKSREKSGKIPFAATVWQKLLILFAAALVIFSVSAFWLHQTSPAKPETLRSFAVLPFTVENTSPDNVVAAQKLTQDLTYNLGRITDARLVSYNAAAFYDTPAVDLGEIGNDLMVDGLITGTIRERGGMSDLEVRIINSRSGAVAWEKSYSLNARSLAQPQYQIVFDIARQLGELKQIQNPTATANYQTYQVYLLARHHLNKRSTKDYEKAVENFEQATIQDASFADAHSGLAIAHILHGNNLYAGFGLSASRESFPMANKSAERALELDPDSDEALTALAFLNYRFDYDWTNAEKNFKKAVAVNPNNVLARHWYGEFLHKTGRFDEGFVQQKQALALEPHSPRILQEIAQGYYLARRFDEAVSYAKDALYIDRKNASLLYNTSEIYEQKGDYKEAADTWKEAMVIEEANTGWIATLEKSFPKEGYRGFARAKAGWLESLIERDYVYPTDLAKSYAALGEKDKAVEWLSKAAEARVPDVLSVGHSPAFDSLRGDARFQAILKQMNFPQ